jgi:hypothetical protein
MRLTSGIVILRTVSGPVPATRSTTRNADAWLRPNRPGRFAGSLLVMSRIGIDHCLPIRATALLASHPVMPTVALVSTCSDDF